MLSSLSLLHNMKPNPCQSDAEAAFAHSLIEKTQALQEGELVAKANDIRRVSGDLHLICWLF